jgi:hypothetical protein
MRLRLQNVIIDREVIAERGETITKCLDVGGGAQSHVYEALLELLEAAYAWCDTKEAMKDAEKPKPTSPAWDGAWTPVARKKE